MNSKEKFLQNWGWECGVTAKVLKALPEGKEGMRPDNKGRTARELGWMLAQEQVSFGKFAQGNPDMSEFSTPMPDSWQAIVEAFEKNHSESKKAIESLSEEDFSTSTIKLSWREATKEEAMMTFMHDMIHHRGQFSVYLRLAGGKVPSIYGPSGDDAGM